MGLRFEIEMHSNADGKFVYCLVDKAVLDVNHIAHGSSMWRWINDCWESHVAGLSGHERLDYIGMGLLSETD